MDKVVATCAEALSDVFDGAVIMVGGFGLCGNPENLIAELRQRRVGGLTVVSNNAGTADKGIGVLVTGRQVRRMVMSFIGPNRELERQYLAGETEVELNPQGTLAERIRAGAFGIGGFYTPTGVGTPLAEGRETRIIQGREYLFETPLTADFALVRAWKADRWGNCVFRKTARNFSPLMCMAAKVTVVEAEEVVELGELDPDQIHVPSIFVQRVVQGNHYQKWIEQRTTRPRPTGTQPPAARQE